MKLPHVVIDARVYLENEAIPGQASVTLPNLQPMSESVKGAGFAGEVELPVMGQYQSMTCKIDWPTPCDAALKLAAPVTRMVTVRGSVQYHDVAKGAAASSQISVVMRVHPKSSDIGKFEKASGSDTSNEMEVLSVRMFLDGQERVHIDKAAYICVFDGVDYAAKIRRDLGIE